MRGVRERQKENREREGGWRTSIYISMLMLSNFHWLDWGTSGGPR